MADKQPAFDLGHALATAPKDIEPSPRPSLADTGDRIVKDIVAQKPHKFTVGGVTDGKGGVVNISYNRKWSNGLGLTAYLKGWWNDASVIPVAGRTSGGMAGFEGEYDFDRK